MKYFIYLFLLWALSSCSKREENFIKIPSDFSVAIQEDIQPTGTRELWLELSSRNSEYCQDDSLIYNSTPGLNSLSIEILNSYKANDCFQRIFFLKSRIKLPDFSDSLQIQLSLGSASVINCSVFNRPNDIEIEINNGTGLITKYDTTYKIPKNLIWGYAYPKSAGSAGLVDNFKKELDYDFYTCHLHHGYYSYFSILDNNVLLLNENPGIVGGHLNFYFTHYKTEVELNQFFAKLASEYVNLVGYKINCGSGKEFNSN